MAAEKWRRRGTFASSISIKDNSGSATPTVLGLLNNRGTIVPTTDGTGPSTSGTVLFDLGLGRLRLPIQATAVGTASAGVGTNNGGSAGAVKLGFSATQAMLAVSIGGTVYQMAWNQAGGSIHVTANPAGA